MLTGCRRNEIVRLEWKNVDLKEGEIRLPDSKTGPRMVPLSPMAARVLEGTPPHQGQSLGDSRLQIEPSPRRPEPLLGSRA